MFKMLTSNISDVVGHLDEIRKESRYSKCIYKNHMKIIYFYTSIIGNLSV